MQYHNDKMQLNWRERHELVNSRQSQNGMTLIKLTLIEMAANSVQ